MPLRLTVSAKPGKNPGITVRGGTIVVAVRERAIDGRANAAIVAALADWLEVRVSDVAIARGTAGRLKHVDVDGIDAVRLAQKIASRRRDGEAG